jgi:hypothetical protein
MIEWLAPLVLGAVGTILALIFGFARSNTGKKLGKEEEKNEELQQKLDVAIAQRDRATAFRPSAADLRIVAERMSAIRPEDN